MNQEQASKIVEIRSEELGHLIDHITFPKSKFLQEDMHFDNRVTLIKEDIIIAGHSMGGSAAILTAHEEDDKVKFLLCHDPSMLPLADKISDESLEFRSDQGFCSLNC
jgi:hypothetical protein